MKRKPMRKKSTEQISFRLETESAAKVKAAAEMEEIAIADFARKVFRRGMREYEIAGSLHAMRSQEADIPPGAKKKAS